MTFTVFHLFCGSGGGALGFQEAEAHWSGITARFRTLGGVDCDPEACEDFESLTGVPATVLDLFSREDYRDYHGHEPLAGWREATAEDLRAAAQWQTPDVVFSSPPCKGFSGLLPKARAEEAKYQALNRLVYRGVWLALEAWKADPPALWIVENVPRITSRGKHLLDDLKALLRSYGYLYHEGFHDAGELGGLGQRRRRYLMVARHEAKVPQFLYRPPRKRLRTIGDVLSELPLPGDTENGGPMHEIPRLHWRTWVRLALIPAGKDWRALEELAGKEWNRGAYFIVPWDEAAGTVTSSASPSSGPKAVADPRTFLQPHMSEGTHPAKYHVLRWDEKSGCVTGSRMGSGAAAIADPRLSHKPRKGVWKVGAWDEPASTVVAHPRPGGSNGMAAVADPRLSVNPDAFKGSPGLYGVQAWDEPAKTVTASQRVSSSNAAAAVADPRLTCTPMNGAYRIVRWDEPAPTVTGAGDVHSQGAAAVADPRIPADTDRGVWLIVAEDGTWHRPLTTLELAALQGFPMRMRDGRPLKLAGNSHARWRERIGNAVPPPAARAIAETMLYTLVAARMGVFMLNLFGTSIWVRGWRRFVSEVLQRFRLRRERCA